MKKKDTTVDDKIGQFFQNLPEEIRLKLDEKAIVAEVKAELAKKEESNG